MHDLIMTINYFSFSFNFHYGQASHTCYQKDSSVEGNNGFIMATHNTVMRADDSVVLTQHLHNGQ